MTRQPENWRRRTRRMTGRVHLRAWRMNLPPWQMHLHGRRADLPRWRMHLPGVQMDLLPWQMDLHRRQMHLPSGRMDLPTPNSGALSQPTHSKARNGNDLG